jgi:NADH-quinone oxidoreductase subunit C
VAVTLHISGLRLAERLNEKFPGIVIEATEGYAIMPAERVVEVATFLRDDEELDCKFLNSLTAVDWIEHFEIVYHLSSLAKNHSAVLKARAAHDRPEVPSVMGVWLGADLQEREAYDLMGITFPGHPRMRRIFLWEGFPGHPLRKDYLALPGGYKPGLQRYPYEFPEGQAEYPALQTEEPTAPAVPRLDAPPPHPFPLQEPSPRPRPPGPTPSPMGDAGPGAEVAQMGRTAEQPRDTVERAHSGPGESPEGRGRADTQGGPEEGVARDETADESREEEKRSSND